MTECTCHVCKVVFIREQKFINRSKKRGYKICCSKKCQSLSQIKLKTYNCTECNKSINRTPSSIKNIKNIFCSSKCSATYNNRHRNIEINQNKICCCGNNKDINAILCHKCRVKIQLQNSLYQTLTLGDKTYTKHKYAKYSYVRFYARKIGVELGFKCCRNCGYDKHFEVCHIKPVSEFTSDTLLTTINSPENLLPLCPNCHYEFDNGKLTIEEINSKYPD